MDKVAEEIARILHAPRLTLVAVRTMPDGSVKRQAELGLEPGAAATEYRRRADAWQEDFDADADPVRVYVLDSAGVAVYAAGATRRHNRRR